MGLKNTFEKLSSKQSISRNQGLQLAKNTAAEWNVYIAFLSQLSKLLKEWKEFGKVLTRATKFQGCLRRKSPQQLRTIKDTKKTA